MRTCQQVFSAAFIGHVEAAYDDEALKNELCTPVPHPNSDVDFLRTGLATNLNQIRWAQDAELTAWLSTARLDIFSGSRVARAAADPANAEALASFAEHLMPAVENLKRLLAEVDPDA